MVSIEQQLKERSHIQCELCKSESQLQVYEIPPNADKMASNAAYLCAKCCAQLEKKEVLEPSHWNCLNESMWSEVPAIQVLSWRMLNRLKNESWASDALDMMYLDDEHLTWAKAMGDDENSADVDLHRDCNGALLQTGDSIVLTKSLDVKGSTLNAKMGTVVKNIKLVTDNTEQIEGRIEGQVIVILTKYVRKST